MFRYKIKCPNCGYQYTMLMLKPVESETCPICGRFGKIEEFLEEEVEEDASGTG
ncbi:MAG: hypothetical protein KKF27_20310 [Gammaproteobacteria bacterium]|nr:hypothetical protein [Gammaproteobacteria bacterium]